MAQSEAPVDFEVFAYVIAMNVGQLWDIFRCFREPTASCVTGNMSRGCNKLFRSYPEGFRSHPWRSSIRFRYFSLYNSNELGPIMGDFSMF